MDLNHQRLWLSVSLRVPGLSELYLHLPLRTIELSFDNIHNILEFDQKNDCVEIVQTCCSSSARPVLIDNRISNVAVISVGMTLL